MAARYPLLAIGDPLDGYHKEGLFPVVLLALRRSRTKSEQKKTVMLACAYAPVSTAFCITRDSSLEYKEWGECCYNPHPSGPPQF